MPTQAKVETVEEFRTRLAGISSVFLTEYRGLTVQQLSELRKQLRAVSAEYKVVKNRLARLAVSSSGLAGITPHLTGGSGQGPADLHPHRSGPHPEGGHRGRPGSEPR